MVFSNSSPVQQALNWWPTGLDDSPLWRWLPLLVAVQAQQAQQLRCKLCDDTDETSQKLLMAQLRINADTRHSTYDLLIDNRWNVEWDQNTTNDLKIRSWLKSVQNGGLILILPGMAARSEWSQIKLNWIYPGVAIDQKAKPNWLNEIEADISTIMERGHQFQRIADTCTRTLNKTMSTYQKKLLQADQQYTLLLNQQHSLLLNYEQRIKELENSSSWRLTAPLRQITDQLFGRNPHGGLPPIASDLNPTHIANGNLAVNENSSVFDAPESIPHLEQKGKLLHNDAYKTVAIVIHEASFTGAPILAWNLARDLGKDHNVIIISLRRGQMEQELLMICTSLITPEELNRDFEHNQVVPILKKLLTKSPIQWAITNSIETWRWPKILRRLGVPSVMLIHEFATYSTEPNAFHEACLWASRVVFSSHLTHQDMKRVYPALSEVPIDLIPQGQCQIPGRAERPESTELTTEPFDLSLLPDLKNMHDPEWLQECLVIMGSGTLAPRKGPDIFISVCSSVVQQQSSKPILCLWLAGPDKTSDYKSTRMWCDDQIRRSDMQGRIVIIHAHQHYDALMKRADLFLMTSRLDPLPNVTLDALHNGVPTLTFDKASGTASWLESDSWLKQRCVAPYLKTEEMARQANYLIDNVTEREETGERILKLANNKFSITQYQQQIRRLGMFCYESLELQTDACKRIETTKIFDSEMGVPPEHLEDERTNISISTQILDYLQSWERHIQPRKPFAGFHPGVFADHNSKAGGDPLDTWLQQGRPYGPWNQNVLALDHQSTNSKNQTLDVAIHIHVHDLDLFDEILGRLILNQCRPTLWISITSPSFQTEIERCLNDQPWPVAEIRCWPNRGRNFGPLMQGLGKILDQNYDIYAHLHTKRSPHLDSNFTARWRNFLLDHLLGRNNEPVMDQIISAFERNSNLGLVYPEDPNCVDWTINRPYAQKLMDLLNLDATEQAALMPPKTSSVDYPIGSMFWARSTSLQRIWDDPWPADQLPQEPLPNDGSILHALERLLPAFCRHAGWTTAVTHIPGSRR